MTGYGCALSGEWTELAKWSRFVYEKIHSFFELASDVSGGQLLRQRQGLLAPGGHIFLSVVGGYYSKSQCNLGKSGTMVEGTDF